MAGKLSEPGRVWNALRIAFLARVNGRCRFIHADSQLVSKQRRRVQQQFLKAKWKKGIDEDMFSSGTGMFDKAGGWREADSVTWRRLAGWNKVVSWIEIHYYSTSIEILCKSYVRKCGLVESVLFEAGSKLQRIEESVFDSSELKSIIIPSSVEVLCKSCFPITSYFHQLHLNLIIIFNALRDQYFT
jgi:hypothetical protein